MKDGRTHLAHKAEHAVDMETLTHATEHVAIVAQAINESIQVEMVAPRAAEVVADKGYHSRKVVGELAEADIRMYSESERGRQDWAGRRIEQQAVYASRRRVRGERDSQLQRQRGEKLERRAGRRGDFATANCD
jgi:transposase